MANIKKLPLFVRCVIQNFPFIEEDFDALTNYELISKVVEYLNKVISSQNEVIGVANDLSAEFHQLHDYVENYFDNLDVQEEINNKLDAMVEAGTLQEIITAYIQSNVAWTFDTVADMKASTNLIAGSYAQTLGFHSTNDGGEALYYITDTGSANEIDVIAVDNLYANLITPKIATPETFGAKGDGSSDDTANFDRAIADLKTVSGKLKLQPKTYMVKQILVDDGTYIEGSGEDCIIKGHGDASESQNRIILGLSKDGWKLKNFKIDVNSAARLNITESDIAVSINGGNNVEIDGLTIIGGTPTNSYCIRVGQNNSIRPKDILIHNCHVTVSNGGFNGIAVTAGLNVTVDNNIVYSSSANCGYAIDIEANTASDTSLDYYRINNIYVTNNTCKGSGIACQGKSNPYSENVIISGNTIEYTVANSGEATEALIIDAINKCIASNNIITYAHPSATTSGTSFNAVRLNADGAILDSNLISIEHDCYAVIRSVGSGNNLIVQNNIIKCNNHTFNRFVNHNGLESAYYINNKFYGGSADYALHFANSSDDVIGNVVIKGNFIQNTKGRGLYIRKHILVEVSDNYIEMYRNLIDNSTTVKISNNIFKRLSSSYDVFENAVNSENTVFIYTNNSAIGQSGSLWNNATNIYSGTQAPVSGTWKRGDIVITSIPVAGNAIGWTCTTAGTPGTWKALANIES